MKYKTRPGIVRTDICGVPMLIPTRKASEECPGVMRLTLLHLGLWEAIRKGDPMENIRIFYRILTKLPDDEVEALIHQHTKELLDRGYLVASDDESA